MKKTISITISGMAFYIEEDGYQKLQDYLKSIHKYFSAYEDSAEIMEDIEYRIAEIFHSKLNKEKEYVSLEDVDALMAQMGSVADFQAAEEMQYQHAEMSEGAGYQNAPTETVFSSEGDFAHETEAEEHTNYRRLFRDGKHKIIAGVASGLAHYLKLDALWIRLLFLLPCLGLFYFEAAPSIPILIYLIMWFILPKHDNLEELENIKKFFRDEDRKILGGVSGGLAAYLGLDLTIVRLIFVASIFLGGTGVFLYLILWVITPPAKSLTEKMQMEGEPITLENIEAAFRKTLNMDEEDSENPFVKILLFPFRIIAMFLGTMTPFIRPVFGFIGQFLRVSSGSFLVFIAFMWLIALTGSALEAGGIVKLFFVQIGDLPLEIFPQSFTNYFWFIGSAYTAGIAPTLLLGILGLSMLVRRKVVPSAIIWSLVGLMVIGGIGLVITGIPVLQVFQADSSREEIQDFQYSSKDPLVITLRDLGHEDYRHTQLKIRAYEGTDLRLVKLYNGFGKNEEMAVQNASMLMYECRLDENQLIFDRNFTFKPDAKFRAQSLDLTLLVPYNQKFILSEDIIPILRNTIYRNGYEARDVHSKNEWMFTPDGQLQCLTCEKRRSDRGDRNRDEEYDFDEDVNMDLGTIEGDTRIFDFVDFSELHVSGAYMIKITQSDKFSVKAISEDKDDLNKVDMYTRGDKLHIGSNSRFQNSKIYLEISMPQLEDLQVSGACKGQINGFNQEFLTLGLTGASSVAVSGSVEQFDLEISGASKVEAFALTTQEANIDISGAGKVELSVEEELNIDASGGSVIKYKGNPDIHKNVSGGSYIKRVN